MIILYICKILHASLSLSLSLYIYWTNVYVYIYIYSTSIVGLDNWFRILVEFVNFLGAKGGGLRPGASALHDSMVHPLQSYSSPKVQREQWQECVPLRYSIKCRVHQLL